MIVIGLTGSIGMGKSTTSQMFKDAGAYHYDADLMVHKLYEGKAVDAVSKILPHVIIDGVVDRKALSQHIIANPLDIKKLEAIIHPLVREEELKARADAKKKGYDVLVLDIPLLFETGGDKRVDKIVVVSADARIQKERVLAREGMSEDKFDVLLAKQMPNDEKCAKADFVIDTGKGIESARAAVAMIMKQLTVK